MAITAMPLKVLCAGYNKDEKFELEKQVRSLFGPPLGLQNWTISLVKHGGQISVSVDGPDERIRSKSFIADRLGLGDALGDLLKNNGFDLPPPSVPIPVLSRAPAVTPVKAAPPRPPAPPPKPAPPLPPKPVPVARVASGPSAQPARSWIPAPSRPITAPPSPPSRPAPPRSSAPSASPAASAAARPRTSSPPPARAHGTPARPGAPVAPNAHQARDTHTCPSCSAKFVVTYDVHSGEPRQLVAVACPHCWKLDRVEIGEGAALERAYRADKA